MKKSLLIITALFLIIPVMAQQTSGGAISSSYFKPVQSQNKTAETLRNDSVDAKRGAAGIVAGADKKETVKNAAQAAAARQGANGGKQENWNKLSDGLTLGVNIAVFLLGSAVILIFVFRGRLFGGKKKNKALKNNIKLLREERLIVKTTGKKNNVRTKLVAETAYLNSAEKGLPQIAKEKNISQGEILLAARIKSYEMAKVCSGK